MRCSCFAIAIALSLMLLPSARADLFVFTTGQSQFDAGTDNQGWWSSGASNSDTNTNYITGFIGASEFRSFFTFDVSSMTDPAVSATLRIRREQGSGSNEAIETLEFFDVSTPAAILNDNTGTNAAIFDDLGTGTSYGSFAVNSAGATTEILEFDLNSNALDEINSTLTYFSVGGALTSNSGGDFLFGFSGTYTAELHLNTCPEPSAFGMLLIVLASGCRHRKRRPKWCDERRSDVA